MSEQHRDHAFLLNKIFDQKYFLLLFNTINMQKKKVLDFFALYYSKENEE